MSKSWFCPNCGSHIHEYTYYYCPYCGIELKKRTKIIGSVPRRLEGFKWCPECQKNRRGVPYNSNKEAFFCYVCGHKLEQNEEGKPEENPECPTCGSPSIKLDMMNVSLYGNPKELMQVYSCTNPKCIMIVQYPEDAEWQTEFVLKDGQKHLVRPSAREFP